MSSLRRSWRCVRLSEAWGVTWRLADASPHEVASLNVRRSKANSPRHNAPHFACLWSQNTALVFAKCEKATGTGPSMARRRAFRIQCPLPFPAGCVRNGWDLRPRRSISGGSSKRVFRFRLTVDDEGTITTTVSATTFREVRKDYLDALPTLSEVHDRFSITYVMLVLHCSVCDDAKSISDGGSNTLFKEDGRFLQILEYRVKLAGMNSSFRNSSVFMLYAVDKSHERGQAFLEVDTLLNHLFRHLRRFCHLEPFAVLHPICCGYLSMWSVRL